VILPLAAELDIAIKTSWLSSKSNTLADALSRHKPISLLTTAPTGSSHTNRPISSLIPASVKAPSYEHAQLLYFGLDPKPRGIYKSAVQNHILYCSMSSLEVGHQQPPPYLRRLDNCEPQESTQIKPQTVESYLSSVRSYCVDRNWDTSIFHHAHIRRLLKGAKSLYRSTKKDRPPITLDHLRALTSSPDYTAGDSNLRAVYLAAFFEILPAGEFTWDQRQYADPRIFHATKATRGDVQFAPNFESLALTLESSKTDVEHTGVRIIIAPSKDPTFCGPCWRSSRGTLSLPTTLCSTGAPAKLSPSKL
jgi:hypothetical protein